MSAPGYGGYREGAGRKPAGYEHPAERIEFEKERAEHERVKRLQREHALAVSTGQYLLRDDVRQASATLLAVLSQSLRSLPDNLERRLSLPPPVVEAIAAEIDSALGELGIALKSMTKDV